MKRYIKSDSGFSKDFDVFMLINLHADKDGWESEDVEGVFFASSLEDARKELNTLQKTNPRLNSCYVCEYNAYLDSDIPAVENYNPTAPENNAFSDLETLARYRGLLGPAYSSDMELPFEI